MRTWLSPCARAVSVPVNPVSGGQERDGHPRSSSLQAKRSRPEDEVMKHRFLLLSCLLAGCEMNVGGASGLLSCATNADCPSGLECELEHGSSWCQPHGGEAPGST